MMLLSKIVVFILFLFLPMFIIKLFFKKTVISIALVFVLVFDFFIYFIVMTIVGFNLINTKPISFQQYDLYDFKKEIIKVVEFNQITKSHDDVEKTIYHYRLSNGYNYTLDPGLEKFIFTNEKPKLTIETFETPSGDRNFVTDYVVPKTFWYDKYENMTFYIDKETKL